MIAVPKTARNDYRHRTRQLWRAGLSRYQQKMTPTPGKLFALTLASISLVGPLAVHLFLPAIPAVKAGLGLSDSLAQLTFSVSLFGMAFANLFYGTLSDRFGRRPMLLSGLGLFLLGSVVSLVADSVWVLVIGRLLQAIGAGCGVTLVRAIASDVYGRAALAKAIAYLTMFYTLGPMLSPLIGGIVVDTFGWRGIFAFALLVGGLIFSSVYAVVYETGSFSQFSRSGMLLRSYAELFGELRFTSFVLQTGFSTGTFLAMATAASTLMQESLHRSSSEFGLYFLLFPLGLLSGNFVSTRLSGRFTNGSMVLAGTILSLITVAAQSGFLLLGSLTPLTLFIPGFFVSFAQGIALPFSQAGAMAVRPQVAGTAAGIGVFIQNLCGAGFAQLYGILADGTVTPLVITTAISALSCLVAGATAYRMERSPRPSGLPAF
jgi:DHA1 family bicyclomycin/chloramphenicol resistance-like MFS transporter